VRDDEEPTRRRAMRQEFSDEEWRLVSKLADHPNRLLVIVRYESGDTYAEVAHEAIFRRWQKLRDWIAAEREFLAWRNGLEADRRAWQATPDHWKNDALLMGVALAHAQNWLAERREDLSVVDQDFIDQSAMRESKARRRAQRVQALVYILLVGIITGLIGWINQSYVKEQIEWYVTVRPYILAQVLPYVLSAEAERALQPGTTFRECAEDCPEMVVVPAGEFIMGSPADENGHDRNEESQHKVVFTTRFAVSKFEVTFDEWHACVTYGDCNPHVSDSGWGRGRRPVIDVTWDYAQRFAAWLSRMTGKPYRLLTEAEWEYAARAGTTTAYSWGDEIGEGNADCDGCGSRWDNRQTAPVGSFPANAFGLHDMLGNVAEWVEDCQHDTYDGAPADGSAWMAGGDCSRRVLRGGAWHYAPRDVRSASREWYSTNSRVDHLGFRVARTLTP
jgi:formylglycine-generating enzyme required for sulfatase activity